MLNSVRYTNFRVLRDATLPLQPFTLILGPNGSGKSTAIQGLMALAGRLGRRLPEVCTVGIPIDLETRVEVAIEWGGEWSGATSRLRWGQALSHIGGPREASLGATIISFRSYSLDAKQIARRVRLVPKPELVENGANLPAVLDALRDQHPERFELLNAEAGRILPEFDRILFDTNADAERGITLRSRDGHHSIPAADLSDGTLLALTLLTIAYLPEPPPLICLEEPDHGIHPRLLRDVQAALYRLAYPQSFGESRPPVQVIATTHSPYFLDLFRDHPEQIVLAERVGPEAKFQRLSDRKDIDEILKDASLGDVWYSGILGGVPAHR